jgi:hypothetical protein
MHVQGSTSPFSGVVNADDTTGCLTSEVVWIAEKLMTRMRDTRSSTVRRAGDALPMSHDIMSF